LRRAAFACIVAPMEEPNARSDCGGDGVCRRPDPGRAESPRAARRPWRDQAPPMTRWLATIAALMLLAAPGAGAKTYKVEGLVLAEPFARPTPRAKPGDPIPAGSAYVTIENKGDRAYQLVGASTPIAGQVEILQAVRVGKSVRTRRMLAVILNPGERIDFAPDGEYRFALVGLRKKMEDGEIFPLILEFDIGKVEIAVEVKYEVYTDSGARYNQRGRPQ
jgi:copper(I)-binding protein